MFVSVNVWYLQEEKKIPKDRLLFHHNGCVLLCVSSVMIKSVLRLELDFLWVSSSSGLSAFVHSQSASELD